MDKNIVILRIENGCPSGVVRYIQMLEKSVLHRSDIKIHIINLNTNLIFPEFEVIEEQVKANIPYPSKSKPLKYELYWLTRYYTVISELLFPYFNNMEMIVWHVQELFLAKLAGLLKLSIGGYVLTHLHIIPWKFYIEYDEQYFRKLYFQWLNGIFSEIRKNPLEEDAYLISDKIACVSMSAKNHITSTFGVNSDKISVIYNGLENIDFCVNKEKDGIIELLFVGRVSREKGVICLLNALEIVYKRGFSCKLNLVGLCTDSMLYHIRKTYKKLDIELLGVITFDDLKKLYMRNMIGVIPSLHEQCSYVAIEMSMFGLPLIVSDVDALSEMFEDGVNALKIPLVFDKDFGLEVDEEKLADAIICLLQDNDLRRKLSMNAIENYYKKFTLNEMIMNTNEIYEQLINNNDA